jgi:hypothetical protein
MPTGFNCLKQLLIVPLENMATKPRVLNKAVSKVKKFVASFVWFSFVFLVAPV